jgi:hypothetical protein
MAVAEAAIDDSRPLAIGVGFVRQFASRYRSDRGITRGESSSRRGLLGPIFGAGNNVAGIVEIAC